MKYKWSIISASIYDHDKGLSGDVECYQWEALKNNYNKLAEQLHSRLQNSKSNGSITSGNLNNGRKIYWMATRLR